MVQIEKIQMTDEDLIEAKLRLEFVKLQKDDSDLTLKELEDTLELGIAKKLLEDDIKLLSTDIKNKTIRDSHGKEIEATEADLLRMNLTLEKFKAQKRLDIPSRQLRLKINQLRDAKTRLDSPDNQIKKLEKQIREKAYEQTVKPNPVTSMVN
jgi:hypothetical protein